jgi:uncharacterized protein YaaR (DUF327 family)
MQMIQLDSIPNTQSLWNDDQSESNSNFDKLKAICHEIALKGEALD